MAHLGSGGIGQVFEAIDLQDSTGSEQQITLKVVAVNLRISLARSPRCRTAVRRTQHLNHQNIVTIRNIERHGDSVFIVMEPLRGRWLSGLIREVRGAGLPYEDRLAHHLRYRQRPRLRPQSWHRARGPESPRRISL